MVVMAPNQPLPPIWKHSFGMHAPLTLSLPSTLCAPGHTLSWIYIRKYKAQVVAGLDEQVSKQGRTLLLRP